MSERWKEIVGSFIGFTIGGVISAFTFTDAKTATGTTIVLIIGYSFRVWQTRRWIKAEDNEAN